jgi:hypothetical protein
MNTMEMSTTTPDDARAKIQSKIERFREDQAAKKIERETKRKEQVIGGGRTDEPAKDDQAQPERSDSNEDGSTGVLNIV